MKTQISQDGFRPDRRYTGVYQQQGRMITDRDWNELVDILKTRVDDALVDVIGTGSPKGRSIKIQVTGGAPRLFPGYVYAGGLAGFVEPAPDVTTFPFGLQQQKGFPSAPPPPPAQATYKIYADLWERPVGALEDEDLRDPALHGADTCTRTQVMTQIKTCPAAQDPQLFPSAGDGRLTLRFPEAGGQTGPDPCDPLTQEVDPVGGDFLFRLEVHDVRWPANTDPDQPERVVLKWSRENGAEQHAFKKAELDWFSAGPWAYELYSVTSEQHLGYHVPVLGNQSWEPRRGRLFPAFPQEEPDGDLIRRWDGYLVLVQSGGLWAVSNEEGETADVTAPGATVTFGTAHHGEITRQVAQIALADLEIHLELFGIFIPGDYWTAPVRRAAYQPGGELLKEAFPNGIYHRYVPLVEVQTNGVIVKPTTAQQRRMAFPRLTDLDAGDLGYTTDCGSGLFNNNHDTVKKALDRLCEIAALHVSYTRPQGGDTSIFRGHNPLTVAQALDLLADVKADDILYTNEQFPSVQHVQGALDELFSRPASGGNYVTVGNGGQYQTIALALEALQDDTLDIALALMPGDHDFGGIGFGGEEKPYHLSIVGLGGATRLHLNSLADTSVKDVASFRLERVKLISQDRSLEVSGCHEVILADNVLESSHLAGGRHFIRLSENKRLVIRGNHIDVQWEVPDPFYEHILELNEFDDILDLFSVNLTEFRERAQGVADGILSSSDRIAIGQGIIDRATDDTTPPTVVREACIAVGQAILDDERNIARRLEDLRFLLYNRKPGCGIVLGPLNGPTIIEGNQGTGLIGLLGVPTGNADFLSIRDAFLAAAREGRFPLVNPRHSLQIRNNALSGVRIGENVVNEIIAAATSGGLRPIPYWYRQIEVSGNVFEHGVCHFAGEEVTINGNNFSALGANASIWTIGSAGLYTSNRATLSFSRILSGIALNSVVQGLNLRINVE